ncbi:type I glyceraldehyde-3-phosphate dehydrogenase [Candidatus Peregrinibacteria bacterium RIFCSPLOWO2_02_FULL_48_14]|nr:MAG: type I glyceraldehyde-3-phosphate dehydrogenase [Candidatus Peregrinibacteria bacterium RIFCSPLOWO2_01_FULL_48_20]OGJ46404.1 MAG: type I glyceraldehyde-3-phosphate dehydrogenase [Candidatus Peregrinibacteria bacterium RIFCSPLOWO2_02_FULL_48_14]
MRVAINGFGRIGRMIFRANLVNPKIDIVAINDLGNAEQTAHLLKYDSNYGTLPMDVKGEEGKITVDGKEYKLVQNREPEQLPWKELGIDLVIECTGAFTTREGASKHLTAGAKRVMISAPAKDAIDRTMVMGVNNEDYNPKTDFIVSNASCTTNGLAPVAKVLHENFGIKCGLMTTIHAYTNDQNLHDNDHKDFRRARAAALNMLPSSTGAAKAIGLVIPALEGKMHGIAIRVPTPVVSLVDLVVEVDKEATKESINAAMKAASEGALKGILGYSDLPLVSTDFKGDNRSSIFDSLETQVQGGHLVKVLSWYDNEWGYSCRCIDLAAYMASKEA